MYKVAVVEDQKQDEEIIVESINRYNAETKKNCYLQCFNNGLQFLSHFESNFDVVFISIEMHQIDGISVAKEIRKIDKNVLIIFISYNKDYAIEGYSVEAIDFFLKPINQHYPDFKNKMDRIVSRISPTGGNIIQIKNPQTNIAMPISNIKYIEVLGHYVTYHCIDGDYQEYSTLKNVITRLPMNNNFSRCHRCYLVNLSFVVKIQNDDVLLLLSSLPISRFYKKDFLNSYNNYVSRKSY